MTTRRGIRNVAGAGVMLALTCAVSPAQIAAQDCDDMVASGGGGWPYEARTYGEDVRCEGQSSEARISLPLGYVRGIWAGFEPIDLTQPSAVLRWMHPGDVEMVEIEAVSLEETDLYRMHTVQDDDRFVWGTDVLQGIPVGATDLVVRAWFDGAGRRIFVPLRVEGEADQCPTYPWLGLNLEGAPSAQFEVYKDGSQVGRTRSVIMGSGIDPKNTPIYLEEVTLGGPGEYTILVIYPAGVADTQEYHLWWGGIEC